ncbi:MAG: hypothetical protein R6V10_11020 [bacterium]
MRKLKTSLLHRKRETMAYLYDLAGHTPQDQVRAVIFAQGRTGSTLLEDLVFSTGHFHKHGELLRTREGEVLFPVRFVRGLSKRQSDRHFIFHVKNYHLTRDRKRPVDAAWFLETLYREGWKIIYLQRRNKVRHALSNIIRDQRGDPFKRDDEKEEIKVVVDCERFVESVKERIRFEKAERKALADIEYHQVVYEDDLEDAGKHQETVERILDYLCLEHRQVKTGYRRINTWPLEELISNYGEFESRVFENGWQSWLDG